MRRMTTERAALPPPTHAGWRVAQFLGLAGLALLLIGLLARPDTALRVLWFGLVPSLPLTLLAAPRLWRNVCPLASLETAVSRVGALRTPSPAWSERASALGMLGFAVLVPLRAVLFDGSATAVLGAALAGVILALAGGLLFRWKSGFCNAFCPMLPVERLYGQGPLLDVENGRCGACVSCTPGACIDLTPRKSIAQLLGRARRSDDWLRTPFGIFTTSFPGLVVGYWLLTTTRGTTSPSGTDWPYLATAYGTVAACAVGATLLLRTLARWRSWSWRETSRSSAALSAAVFYGLTAHAWAEAWSLGAGAAWALRVSAWLLVVVWLVRTGAPAARNS